MRLLNVRGLSLSGLVVLITAALVLSGCTATTTSTRAATVADLGHVHGFALDPATKQTFVATHRGTWRLDSGYLTGANASKQPTRVGDGSQDTMGFTINGSGQMFASGHPDPKNNPRNDPANLGLITSKDSAKTRKTVSLNGKADFHDIVAVTDAANPEVQRFYGYDAGRQTIRVSTDSGRNWDDGAFVPLRQLAVNDAVSSTVYATTEAGLEVSYDAGSHFRPAPDAPSLYLIDAINTNPGGFVGVDINNIIWTTNDSGTTWTQEGQFASAPEGIRVVTDGSRSRLLCADKRGIVATADYGKTWAVLVPGKP